MSTHNPTAQTSAVLRYGATVRMLLRDEQLGFMTPVDGDMIARYRHAVRWHGEETARILAKPWLNSTYGREVI